MFLLTSDFLEGTSHFEWATLVKKSTVPLFFGNVVRIPINVGSTVIVVGNRM
jgi:hypothetical protein